MAMLVYRRVVTVFFCEIPPGHFRGGATGLLPPGCCQFQIGWPWWRRGIDPSCLGETDRSQPIPALGIGCTPIPTYPYGKSLYMPYKYHGYTVRGTPNCPLIQGFFWDHFMKVQGRITWRMGSQNSDTWLITMVIVFVGP